MVQTNNSFADASSNTAVIVGGGLTGLLAALKLSKQATAECPLVLIAPKQASTDGRTTAMLMPTIEVLRELDIWEGVAEISAPLRVMRLVDGSKRLIRAPIADFVASEMQLDAFGYNVPNAHMVTLMEEKIAQTDEIVRIDAQIIEAHCENGVVSLALTNGTSITTTRAIAADGRNSIVRKAAGIGHKTWSYPQAAVVLTFAHSLPHHGVSAEFHTETGPFTQVPLPEHRMSLDPKLSHRSSLVWVVKPEQAMELLNKPLEELSRMVEEGLQSSFGKVQVENVPQGFPLSGMSTNQYAANNVFLVGESCHVFPPIGAQGFNLGVRDVMDLSAAIAFTENAEDRYNSLRKKDVWLRTQGVDLLNRSLLTSFLPVQMARAAGISLLNTISPLRRLAMKQGLGASSRGWL